MMSAAKRLMYAQTAEHLRDELVNAQGAFQKYPKFVEYLEALYSRRQEWALCLRLEVANDGHNTNNIVEAAFRVLKDSILHR